MLQMLGGGSRVFLLVSFCMYGRQLVWTKMG
jgi:hypothetical protein